MKPAYATKDLSIDNDMSSLNSLPEIENNLDTIDEDNPDVQVQEVKTFLEKHDSHENDFDGDSDYYIPGTNELNHSEAEKDNSHLSFLGNRLLRKSSPPQKPIPVTPPQKRFEIPQESDMYNDRDSMSTIETGAPKKPLKTWYRGLVIHQSCHSQMAEDMINKDMYFNTISVGITAITSSAIFTSLAPNSDGGIKTAGGGNTLAVSAGILAAFNTVLQAVMKTVNYARKGEQHLAAFKRFTKMRFKMENLIGNTTTYDHHDQIDEKKLNDWIEKYEELLEQEPIIPQEILEEITEKEDSMGLRWTSSGT